MFDDVTVGVSRSTEQCGSPYTHYIKLIHTDTDSKAIGLIIN